MGDCLLVDNRGQHWHDLHVSSIVATAALAAVPESAREHDGVGTERLVRAWIARSKCSPLRNITGKSRKRVDRRGAHKGQ